MHERELPRDPLGVEPPEQPPRGLWRDAAAAARDREENVVPQASGIRRPEQRRGTVASPGVGHAQHQARVGPPARKPAIDRVELVDESQGPEHKLTLVAKVEQKGALSRADLRDFFREMLLIRRFEEKVEERFRAGELPGFLHVAIGQEAVAVGVCRALEEGDIIASTHRAHGHTLAKGTTPNELMAELYGKLEGCSHGYGGSMHLYDIERGNMGANAVVGGGLPAIVGAALAFQFRSEPRVAVAFFGDGATNIGTFHESLNMAQLWKVPALFVCEDNHWAESTPAKQHMPIDDISERAAAYGMKAIKVDGQDVEAVYKATRRALEYARGGKGPVFLAVRTHRLVGHYIGDPQVYRSKEEFAKERETQDPIDHLRAKLELTDDEVEEMDREVQEIVEASVEFAKNGTDPKPEDALKNVYA
jgi:acetoin:2,6-dichlorophenolindophenol oxidoreductase subunit alpha